MYKKTLILQGLEDTNHKAIFNIEKSMGEIVGEVKLYNFKSEMSGILTLGIKSKDEVMKVGLTKVSSTKYIYKLPIPKTFDDFSVVLVNINNGKATPVLQGSSTSQCETQSILASASMELGEHFGIEKVKCVLDKNNIELEEQGEIDNLIDDKICQLSGNPKCQECKYRSAFFGEEENKENFYCSIREDIDKLFESCSQEQILMQIIPDSKWVKIDNEEDGSHYVLGLIYENDIVKYICYGTPAYFDEKPPKEIENVAEWLPIDSTNIEGFGYFITYQSAESGENIKANFTVV